MSLGGAETGSSALSGVRWLRGFHRARHRGSKNRRFLRQSSLGAPVEHDPTRMCELLVSVPEVNVLGRRPPGRR